jgi:CheY-like chemotaxis protein
VLIVDDDHAIRLALQNVLRRSTFDVHLAGTGCEALALLDRQHIDAAVIDVMMPRLDGVGVMSALLARPEAQRPRVVFAITAPGDYHRPLGSLGVRRVFPKPLDAVRLAEELTRALSAPAT